MRSARTAALRPAIALAIVSLVVLAAAPTASALDARYHNYDETHAEILALAASYPSIVKVDTLGVTATDSLDVWAVKVSDNVDVDEDEPVVLFDGVHHAEEVMGLEVIMWMLDELTASYGVDDTMTQWVDDLEIWFIPILNPEGHNIVTAEIDTIWRKNKFDNNDNGVFDLLDDGVDLNYNYDFNWDQGGSDNPQNEYYRGPSAGSENETQMLCNLCLETKPLFSLNYHSPRSSDGDLVYYPWYWPLQGFSPDHYTIYPIATTLAARTLTEADEPFIAQYGYADAGKCRNWQYGVVGTIGLTMEILSQLCQPSGDRVDGICERVANGSYYLLERAEGPGLTGHVTDAGSRAPLVAEVKILENTSDALSPRTTDATYGRYWRPLAPATYTVEVSAFGYDTQTFTDVVVDSTGWTTLDCALESWAGVPEDASNPPRITGVSPNPFSGSATLSFTAPGAKLAGVEIYSASGRLVSRCEAELERGGAGEVVWDGRGLTGRPSASGVYFARLITDAGVDTVKMVYIR
jgi:carboxypeptidase T